jgi:hypothetical protein
MKFLFKIPGTKSAKLLSSTHTLHEIPLQDSQYRIYLQHTDLSFQWRYPVVAFDRVPGSLAG